MDTFDFETYFQRLLAADDFTLREDVRAEFIAYLNSIPEAAQRELRGVYEAFVRQRNQKDLAALEVLREILGERKAA